MKKTFVILSIILGSIACFCILIYVVNNTINLKKSELHLVKEFNVDLNNTQIYQSFNMKEGMPFTCFFQPRATNVEDIRNHYLKQYNIELPEFEFDFNNYNMAISFGRKIVDIKYYKSSFGQSDSIKKAHITFDNEYSDGKVYIYQMDKIIVEDGLLEGNYYYRMNGNKKEFVGRTVFDLNK